MKSECHKGSNRSEIVQVNEKLNEVIFKIFGL